MSDQRPQQPSTVVQAYPSVARWVRGYGWIEIGLDLPGNAFIQALDDGGMVWEGAADYPTIDHALQALDIALAEWFQENGSR